MSAGNKSDKERQGPKILHRKRAANIDAKRNASLGNATLETLKSSRQRPSLFRFTMTVLYKNLYILGITLLRRRLRLSRRLRLFRSGIKGRAYAGLERVRLAFGRFLFGFMTRVKAPFLRIGRTYREVKPAIEAKRDQGKIPFAAYFEVLETVWRLIFKILATIFNYTAPVAAAILLFYIIQQGINRPMVVTVEYGGEVIGYIHNQSEFTEAARDVQSRVTADGESAFKILNPHYELMTLDTFENRKQSGDISETAGHLSTSDLTDKLIEASGGEVYEAYGLYIDNAFLGAVLDKNAILAELARIKRSRMTGKPDEELEFVKSIRLTTPVLYPKESLTSSDSILRTITGNETADEIYVAKSGDTPTGIADKTGVPYSVLKGLNPDIESDLYEGKEIYTQVAHPFLSVASTFTDIVDEEVEFETVEVQNATYAKGYRDVFQEGVNGSREVTYRVKTINGLETERTEISSAMIKYPVAERVTVGVNDPQVVLPSWPPQTTQPSQPSGQTPAPAPAPSPAPMPAPSSGFMWPVGGSGGTISCALNGYWGHTGIDISRAGGTGTPILASASGTVVVAKSNIGGYGRHVIIDHGNGYQTLYAHNSALYVSVGDRVAQGQVIAAMGQTGNAFGVHLHFEVRQNGRIMNPVNYVGSR